MLIFIMKTQFEMIEINLKKEKYFSIIKINFTFIHFCYYRIVGVNFFESKIKVRFLALKKHINTCMIWHALKELFLGVKF